MCSVLMFFWVQLFAKREPFLDLAGNEVYNPERSTHSAMKILGLANLW